VDGARPDVVSVLEEAQARGLVGPGPVAPHLAHGRGFAALVPEAPAAALDLGSGGGLPAFALLDVWPGTAWVLLDAGERRCAFLRWAVGALGVEQRVTVVRARAEEAAHDPDWRARFSLVVARSFGPPAVTAECAAGFLAVGGRLVVSEPPEPDAGRWAPTALAELGLAPGEASLEPARYRSFVQATPCPVRYPRRPGIPAKRPLF
jgi:16S rRNA (guanine527-N7)-methyltransferase